MKREVFSKNHLPQKAIEAIKANNQEEAVKSVEAMWNATSKMHDGLVNVMSLLFNYVAEKHGEAEVGEAWKYIGEQTFAYVIKALKAGKLTVEQMKKNMIEAHVSHVSDFIIEEDDEKITLIVTDCGVAGKLAKEGKLDNTERHPMNLGTIKGEHSWCFGQKGIPYYCVHAPVYYKVLTEELGWEVFDCHWDRQRDENGNPVDEPCKTIFYKKPKS